MPKYLPKPLPSARNLRRGDVLPNTEARYYLVRAPPDPDEPLQMTVDSSRFRERYVTALKEGASYVENSFFNSYSGLDESDAELLPVEKAPLMMERAV